MGERTFYKTDADFRDEIGIGPREFKTAKSKLKQLKLITTTCKSIPRKTYYKLEETALLTQISNWAETHQLGGPKHTNWVGRNAPTNTENTTETNREGNKRPLPQNFEAKAKASYQATKRQLPGLPSEFFNWFESEVLARWDKYEVNPTVLKDWHELLWTKYEDKYVAAAMAQHRQQVSNNVWRPDLCKVRKIARELLQEAQRLQRKRQAAEEKGAEEKKCQQGRKYVPDWKLPENKALEAYELQQGNPFVKEMFRKHRPEIVEKVDNRKATAS